MSARPPSLDIAPQDVELEAAASELGIRLVTRGWQLATAESCTGGMIGHVITQIPGSSGWFAGGIISYSNAAKQALLDVPGAALEQYGAVSAEVASAMATGALVRFDEAWLAVAVTGVAGPDGGTEAKPVGLTYLAVAVRDGASEVERHLWLHDRDGNKRASVLAALRLAHRLAEA